MKLISFSVTNYRSITTAHKILLSNLTVLVGKNNEGKSNLLTALNTAMITMLLDSDFIGIRTTRMRRIAMREIGYDWERDFPLQFQKRKSGLESIFNLSFRLEESELEEFHNEIKIGGNEDIPIRIRFNKENNYKIEVPKKGSSSYNKKSSQITNFISQRIAFNYIKAIRTESMALSALMNVIREELRELDNNPEYNEAQKRVLDLQQEAFGKISKTLIGPLKVFLPNIKDVKIVRNNASELFGRTLRGDIDVIIDDGTPTSISFKGDGIKSLAALALLQERKSTKAASIIAIEEPESHLHSGAIHSLVEVITKISERNQVILTTHNPLFVQRNNISLNVIVDKGRAYSARNISEIREVLGILPADNLKNANKVLVVEGEDDLISLNKILSLKSEKILTALRNNDLIIQPLHGASNLTHALLELRRSVCEYVVLLDNDEAGKSAFIKATNEGLLNIANTKFTVCNGSSVSEFEDCIKPSVYEQLFFTNYGINIKCKEFHSSKKWSDRMKDIFCSQGMIWSDSIERKIKYTLAENLPDTLDEILIPQKSGFIDGLVTIIEMLISRK